MKLALSNSTSSSRLVCEKRKLISKHVKMPEERLKMIGEQFEGGYDIRMSVVLVARSISIDNLQCLVS